MAIDAAQAQQVLERLEKLPSAARYAIMTGLAALLVVLYWFMLGSSMSDQVTALERQLTKVQDDISEARAVASNLKSFRERREALQTELTEALQKLPNQKELPGLLTDMSGLGKKSGLEVRSFNPGDETNRGFYAEVPIRVEFYGSYHDIGIFFDRLSKLQRIVNITQLKLQLADTVGDRPKLKAQGVATTFRFLDVSGTAAGE
jgi:type IV pilus assembly protein PilO